MIDRRPVEIQLLPRRGHVAPPAPLAHQPYSDFQRRIASELSVDLVRLTELRKIRDLLKTAKVSELTSEPSL